MTTRRAEIPSLNASITRKIRYVTGADSFGSMRTTTLSRVTRARLLEASPTDRLRIANPQFQDKALRRYLVRPGREMLTYTFTRDPPRASTEERTISLDWDVDRKDQFTDGRGVLWDLRGVGYYDSAGRMLEILASMATSQP